GWNLVIRDSKDIIVRGGKYEYGGYECIGTEDVENVTFDDVYSGIGWRTSLQIHRGSKNVKVLGGTIKQNEANAHSALTIHGSESSPVEDVKIDNLYLDSVTNNELTGRGGIQSVEGHEHDISITNSTI